MFERFTSRARRVMQFANQAAQVLNHEYIGTEHILLGLLQADPSVAAMVLEYCGLELQRVQEEVVQVVPVGPDMVIMGGRLPNTPQTRRVLESSVEEASNLGHDYVGTEHVLLGLLREQEGVAAQVLTNLRLKLEDIREKCLSLLPGLSLSARLGLGSATLSDSPTATAISQQFPPKLTEAIDALDIHIHRFEEALLGIQAEQESEEATRLHEESDKLKDKRTELLQELPSAILQAREDFEGRIIELTREKENAVAQQDWKVAAQHRDEETKVKFQRRKLLRDWPTNYPIEKRWLSWNDGVVVHIAETIRKEKHWDKLLLLADALEEAGCTNSEILDHCRTPENHTTHCWVIDLLLAER